MKRLSTISAFLCFVASPLQAETFHSDVWADNWFEMRINGTMIAQDSVPITTERSFNAESFSFETDRPFVIGLVAKDFKQDDTGLEYIGSFWQQMGDGGIIVQVKDAEGKAVALSNSDWQCIVIHTAPIDKSCADERSPVPGQGPCKFDVKPEPEGWDQAGFDASAWPKAIEYSESAVRPKGGYDRISWDRNARLIWGPDLEQSNTILCRLTVE